MLNRNDNIIAWDIGGDIQGDKAESLYVENFCLRGLSLLEKVIFPLFELDLYGLLYMKQEEADLKESVRDFVDHEISVCLKETDIMRKFVSEAHGKKNNPDVQPIPICSISPFFFVNYPFPLV